MDWQWFVWRGLGSRWARKTALGSITALVAWSLLWGPLIEWRQRQIMTRMEHVIETIFDVQDPQPVERDHVVEKPPGVHDSGAGSARVADPDQDEGKS